MRNDKLKRPRNCRQVDGFNQERAITNLALRARAQESVQLRVHATSALRRLILESPKGSELALFMQHGLDGWRAQSSDQFVLEIDLADEESPRFQIGAALHRPQTRAPKSSSRVVLLGGITQAGQVKSQAGVAEFMNECAQIRNASDRDGDDAFCLKVQALPPRQRVHCCLIAPALDQDRSPCTRFDSQRARGGWLKWRKRAGLVCLSPDVHSGWCFDA